MAPKFPWSFKKKPKTDANEGSSSNDVQGASATGPNLTDGIRNLEINDRSSYSQINPPNSVAAPPAEEVIQPDDPPPVYEENASSQAASTTETRQPESLRPIVFTTSRSLLEKGIETIQKAIDADNAGSYPSAYAIYTDALKYFLAALRHEQNPQSRTLIQKKTEEYMERAEILRAYLSGNIASSAGSGSGGSSGSAGTGTVPPQTGKSTDDMIQFLDNTSLSVKWTDMGGVSKIQKDLLNAVILPTKFPQLFTGLRKPTTRILLYGPPGNGKQTLVKALSVEAKRTLLRVNASELSRYDLKGAANVVSQLFTTARALHQAIIVRIDDFDLVSSQVGKLILQELDSSNDKDKGNLSNQVILIGITTKPWDLQSNDMLKIFQETVHVSMPDEASRKEIFAKQIDQIRSDDQNKSINSSRIDSDGDLILPEKHARLAQLAEGFSVRDIVDGVVKVALMGPVSKIQMATHWKKIMIDDQEHFTPCSRGDIGAEPRDWTTIPSDRLLEPPLMVNDFIKAAKDYKPSVDQELVAKFDPWEKNGLAVVVPGDAMN